MHFWKYGCRFADRPAIPPFDKNSRMNDYEMARIKQMEDTAKYQKESQLLAYKQDCRRTAIQLSERFSVDGSGNKPADVSIIIMNAELVYEWMVNFDKPNTLLKDFMEKGTLHYKSAPATKRKK